LRGRGGGCRPIGDAPCSTPARGQPDAVGSMAGCSEALAGSRRRRGCLVHARGMPGDATRWMRQSSVPSVRAMRSTSPRLSSLSLSSCSGRYLFRAAESRNHTWRALIPSSQHGNRGAQLDKAQTQMAAADLDGRRGGSPRRCQSNPSLRSARGGGNAARLREETSYTPGLARFAALAARRCSANTAQDCPTQRRKLAWPCKATARCPLSPSTCEEPQSQAAPAVS
jgi:hypothetical protein